MRIILVGSISKIGTKLLNITGRPLQASNYRNILEWNFYQFWNQFQSLALFQYICHCHRETIKRFSVNETWIVISALEIRLTTSDKAVESRFIEHVFVFLRFLSTAWRFIVLQRQGKAQNCLCDKRQNQSKHFNGNCTAGSEY